MGDRHWPLVRQGHALIPPSDGAYLEVGVGSGYSLRSMATHQYARGRCLGIDVSKRMVELARAATVDLSHVQVEVGDFLDPQARLDDGPFSAIFSMEVFYYFADIQEGIDRACSLLEPGGCLMVMVDYFAENEVSHSWPEDIDTTMCLWSSAQYRRGFQRSGFRDVQQHTFSDPDGGDPDSLGTLCTVGVR